MIRPADPVVDSRDLAAIYNYYVAGTTISFEEKELTPAEMEARVRMVKDEKKFPFYVYECQQTKDVNSIVNIDI